MAGWEAFPATKKAAGDDPWGAFPSANTNVARETGSKDSGGPIDEGSNPLLRFAAGMGGRLVNQARGIAQTFIDPVESMGVDNPNPVVAALTKGLKSQVSHTQDDIQSMGLAGTLGSIGADILPAAVAPARVLPQLAVQAAQGLTTPEGEGDDVNRSLNASVMGTVGAVIPAGVSKAVDVASHLNPFKGASRIVQDAMGTVKDLPAKLQERVFNRAQGIVDEGRRTGVKVTGPEAIQQALDDLGQGTPNRLGVLQRTVEQSRSGEGQMAQVVGPRAADVQKAGREAIDQTFGPRESPETAVKQTEEATKNILTGAVQSRTAASEDYFRNAAKGVALPKEAVTDDIAALKREVDQAIAQKGTVTSVGRKLATFRDALDQGAQVLKGKGFTVQGDTQALGPLQQFNRETAINLRRKYNPQDADKTFDAIEGGVIGPLNERLTSLLTRHSPEYGQALEAHIAASPDVNLLQYGPVGRMMEGGSEIGSRMTTLSNEFLDPQVARPAAIRKLAAQLNRMDPKVLPNLVGNRIEGIFAHATRTQQQGSNPWGGANFIKELMGNAQARENLKATVQSLPDGNKKWAAFQKLATVLRATGKRRPQGSETAMNLAASEDLQQGLEPVRALTRPLDTAAHVIERWAASRNGAELARVFTSPKAVREMQNLLRAAPGSPKAKNIVARTLLTLEQTAAGRLRQPSTPEEERHMTIDAPQMENVPLNAPVEQVASSQAPQKSFLSKLIHTESKGQAGAKNPRSSATGAAQFTNNTWLHMIDQYRPELMIGKSVPEILALRKDPELAREMAGNYASENAAALGKEGLPVTDTTLYLAHFLGPKDAKRLLTAKIGTPVAQVVNAASIKANPKVLLGKKAEDVLYWAQGHMKH